MYLPEGADDGVGLHFLNGQLHRVVSSRPEARAYYVQKGPDGATEQVLDPEYLGQ